MCKLALVFLVVVAAAFVPSGSCENFAYKAIYRNNVCTVTKDTLQEVVIYRNATCYASSMFITCNSSGYYEWSGCDATMTPTNRYDLGCSSDGSVSYHCDEAVSVEELVNAKYLMSEPYNATLTASYPSGDTDCTAPVESWSFSTPTLSFLWCSPGSQMTWTNNGTHFEKLVCTDSICSACTPDSSGPTKSGACLMAYGTYKPELLTIPLPVPPVATPADAPVEAPVAAPAAAPVAAPFITTHTGENLPPASAPHVFAGLLLATTFAFVALLL